MLSNPRRFQESITKELDTIKNRVRDLIGAAHWGEEGRYKEAILKNTLKKFLPSNVSVGSGFILNQYDISRQLDIVVYDNRHPVLFAEGDFIITSESNVLGIVEVKSRLNATTIREALEQFDESIQGLSSSLLNRRIFCGIFAFDYEGNFSEDTFRDILRDSERRVNHISLGINYFIRKWKKEDGARLRPRVNTNGDFYNLYEIDTLSFSYFISNLVDIVSGGLNDRYWLSFPIVGTKEVNNIGTIDLQPEEE